MLGNFPQRLVLYCRTTSASTHLAHPGGCAALRIVLVTVPRVSRSYGHFPDEFNLHLLQLSAYTLSNLCTFSQNLGDLRKGKGVPGGPSSS